MRRAWQLFIQTHQVAEYVPPLVAAAWQRCWGVLDPLQKPVLPRLSSAVLLDAQVAAADLLLLARPVMEDLHQYMEGSMTVVLLANSAGYVLDWLGDAPMLEQLQALGIQAGALMAEAHLGSNAVSLALRERVPVQLSGAAHYCEAVHPFAMAAAPIFEPSGRLWGVLGIATYAENIHAHSLAMVVAGAHTIEAQRQADLLLGESNTQLAELNAVLNSMEEGILVWNAQQILLHANPAAEQILGLPLKSYLGKPLDAYVQLPSFVRAALRNQQDVSDVETTLQLGQRSLACVVSLRFLRRGTQIHEVVAILRRAEQVRLLVQKQTGAQAAFRLDEFVGESTEIRRVRRQARQAAAARAPILLRGEPGVGKNLLARAIHQLGQQREGPFVVFACSSVPHELMLNELLGQHSGSAARPSKFELANNGTLYLQDVDSLPLEAQAALLNVLELGLVLRPGSRRPLSVSLRVIASCTHSLEQAVAQGSFRADLFYRLSPFEIVMPSLRERIADLPLLADQILRRLGKVHQRTLKLSDEALALLQAYDWPGNVRELEMVLERALVQAGPSQVIAPLHLPDFVRLPELRRANLQGVQQVKPLADLEEAAILQAAQACKGNLTRMSELLGVGRTTLWRRLKQMGVSLEVYRRGG